MNRCLGLLLGLGHGAGQVAAADVELDGDQPLALVAVDVGGPGCTNEPCGSGRPSASRESPGRPAGGGVSRPRSFKVPFKPLPVNDGRSRCVPVGEGPVLAPLTGVADWPGVGLEATCVLADLDGNVENRVDGRPAAARASGA